MPFLMHTALTCATPSPPSALICVPSSCGLLRGVDRRSESLRFGRQDAARMQHLGAAAGDLLRFVVMQRAQQPRLRRVARIGAEHARHVGPDLQPPRARAWRRRYAAEVSEPPRPSSTVSPAASLAMNPWVTTTPGTRAELRAAAPGRARTRRSPTENWRAPRRRRAARAFRPVRASHQLRLDALRVEKARAESRSPSARRWPARARACGR